MRRLSVMGGTLSDVTEDESERFALRFRPGTKAELQAIADRETEGNVSFLVRRYVYDGIARDRRRTRRTPTNEETVTR